MVDRPITQDASGDEQNVREIEEISAELEASFVEHDAAKFDDRFPSDVVAVDGRRFHGWDGIHSYHRERLTHHADDIRTWYETDRITFPTPSAALGFLSSTHRAIISRMTTGAGLGLAMALVVLEHQKPLPDVSGTTAAVSTAVGSGRCLHADQHWLRGSVTTHSMSGCLMRA